MPLLREADLRALSARLVESRGLRKSAQVLTGAMRAEEGTAFDVFVSHSFLDSDLVLGLRLKLEQFGLKAYVDWADDPQLDRASVSKGTAELLRSRMRSSRSLFYAVTGNASASKWMPWECGFFDGLKGRVAICPVVSGYDYHFSGQEYLGIYPYVSEANDNSGRARLWVQTDTTTYVTLENWLSGSNPVQH